MVLNKMFYEVATFSLNLSMLSYLYSFKHHNMSILLIKTRVGRYLKTKSIW